MEEHIIFVNERKKITNLKDENHLVKNVTLIVSDFHDKGRPSDPHPLTLNPQRICVKQTDYIIDEAG